MAHTIPDQILDFDKASSEDVIFNAPKNGLGDDYWVFHSLSVNQTSTNGVFYEKEIDFVVYHREDLGGDCPHELAVSDGNILICPSFAFRVGRPPEILFR